MLALLSAGTSKIPQSVAKFDDTIWFCSRSTLVKWDFNIGTTQTVPLGSPATCIVAFKGLVIAGTQDGKLHAINQTDGTATNLINLGSSVTCLAAESDGNHLIVGLSNGTVSIYKTTDLEQMTEFTLPNGVFPLALAASSGYLAIGGTSKLVYLTDLQACITGSLELAAMSGHDDWVHTVAFNQQQDGKVLLASGSQDRYIRLWAITKQCDAKTETSELSTKPYVFSDSQAKLEALLIGHDDWVVSLAWEPNGSRLLSASSDSSLILWVADGDEVDEVDETVGTWLPQTRLGDVSIMGASTATGAIGGLWTAIWLDKYILSVSKTGSWRIWDAQTFQLLPGPTGHYGTVTDACWLGDCVLSTSLDQTTRMWSKFESLAEGVPLTCRERYFEASRPQIHGYDLVGIAPLKESFFVSAGDEKVVRVFKEPTLVAKLTNQDITSLATQLSDAAVTVPALGLSNKTSTNEAEETSHGHLAVLDPHSIPTESALQRLTLWPEVEKIYGHGYEISCVDVSPNNELMASCCKAKSERHAGARIYSTDSWAQTGTCSGHSMTVTRCRFSPDSKRLLTVSRDRQWILSDLLDSDKTVKKSTAHSRIIWDCCWINNDTFATVSRDKTVRVWDCQGSKLASASFDEPVTACDYSPTLDVLIVGTESGKIYCLNRELNLVDRYQFSGDGRINRIRCKSTVPESVAIASETLRVYDIPA